MSRVIKTPEENTAKIKWTKQITCPMCHAFIEYSNLDVHKKLDGYNYDMDIVVCPYCEKWFSV